MKKYWSKWIYLSVVMLTGAVCGSLLLQALPLIQQHELQQGIQQYVQWMKQVDTYDQGMIFWDVFFKHLKWVLVLSILGITIIGVPLVIVMNFLKGFFLGSSVYMLVQTFGEEGIWLTLITLVPQNMIAIPAIIVVSSAVISFASFIFHHRLRKHDGVWSSELLQFSTITTAMVLVLAGAALIEVYISPLLLQWHYMS